MRKIVFHLAMVLFAVAFPTVLFTQPGQWLQQPISGSVPGLWAISMVDTGQGVAAGIVDLPGGVSGILLKYSGDPTWHIVDPSGFTPSIPTNFTAWYAIQTFPGSSIVYACGNNSKVYKSTDGGTTWNIQNTGITVSKTLFGMNWQSATQGLVVGADGVAYYTSNGGTSWTAQTTGTTQNLLAVHASSGSYYVSGMYNTMLKFTPPSSWQTLSVAPYNFFGQALSGVQFLSGTTGFTSGGNLLLNGSVLKTTDGGTSWSTMNIPNQGAPYFFYAIKFFSENEGWAANVFDAIYYTNNGGTSWTTYAAVPTVGLAGGVTELSFPSPSNGYASGGALGGGGATSGWIIKWGTITTQPDISSTTDTLDFGSHACGTSFDLSFKIYNTGTAPLDIPANGITFSNTDISLVSPVLPQTIPVSGELDCTIRWTPATGFNGALPAGTKLTIQSNDPVYADWEITLLGSKTPERIVLSTNTLDFGSLCSGSTADITADGTAQGGSPQFLGWTLVSGNDNVSVLSPSVGAIITGTQTFTFRIAPAGTSTPSATYYFISGDPSCPDTAVVTVNSEVRYTSLTFPATLDFGAVCTEHFSDIVYNIQNTGKGPSQILSRDFVSGNDLFPSTISYPSAAFPEGNTVPFTFRFQPGQFDTGYVSGTYRYIFGPCPDTMLVTFTGYSVKDPIQVIPTNVLILGPTPVGGTNDAQIEIRNTTGVPVEIASIRLAPTHASISWINFPALPVTIDAGQQLTLDIRYTPTVIETLSADLCVRYTTPCEDSVCIRIAASSSESPNIVLPASAYIGLQQCDTPIRDSIPVYNAGPGLLTITNLLFGGLYASNFTIVEPATLPMNITAQDTGYIVVEFSYSQEDSIAATLIVDHNDVNKHKQSTLTVTGKREVSKFELQGDTTTMVTTCFRESETRAFTIANPSAHTVELTGIALDPPTAHFSLSSPSLPVSLDPGDSIQISVTLTGDFSGQTSTTLRIVSEPCTYTRTYTLTGYGYRTQCLLSPDPLAFGNVSAGTSSAIGIEISNPGIDGITIDSIALNPSSDEFALSFSGSFPFVLSAGTDTTISAEYSPLSGKGLTGQLCAYISAPCPDTVCIDVSGSSNTDVLTPGENIVDIYLDPCSTGEFCGTTTVRNFAAIAHTISGIALQQNGTVFAVRTLSSVPFTIDAGDSFPVEICATGIFSGTDTAVVTLTSSTGAQPVVIRFVAHRDSAQLSIPSMYDFGVMAACMSSTKQTIPVQNIGTADDTLVIVQNIAAPFSLVSAFPFATDGTTTTGIDVQFSPSGYGSYTDTLIVRTQLCGTEYRIVIQASYFEDNVSILPDTLAFTNVQTGTSVAGVFSVTNLNLSYVQVASVFFSDPAYTCTTTLPAGMNHGITTPFTVQFSPTTERDYPATVCVVTEIPCADTICIPITGRGVQGALSIAPSTALFDSVAQCYTRIDTFTVNNTGTGALSLDSSIIEGPSAAAFSIIDPIVGAEQLQPGASRVFHVAFDAVGIPVGAIYASLRIVTGDPLVPSISAQLSGYRAFMDVPDQILVSFGTMQAGSPSQQDFSISNPGSVPFTYTAATIPAGVTLTPALPVTILPGESVPFHATVTPLTMGAYSASVILTAGLPCPDSTELLFSGDVSSGLWTSGVLRDTIASCDSAVFSIWLHNPLSLNAEITGVNFTGMDSLSFSFLAPGIPVSMSAGDSVQTTLRFLPEPSQSRTYTAECIYTILVNGIQTELRAAFTVEVFAPELTCVSSLDLGSVPINMAPLTDTVRIVNTGVYPVAISDGIFDDSQFELLSSDPVFPAALAPNDTLTCILEFSPTGISTFSSSLAFSIAEPCADVLSIPFTATGLPADILDVDIRIASYTGAVDDTVLIPIELLSDLGSEGIDGWSMGLEFNKWMLYPLGIVTANTLSADMSATMDYDFDHGVLRLSSTGGTLRPGTGTLVAVRFFVTIGNDVKTRLNIQDSVWVNTTSEIRLQKESGSFTLVDYCFNDGRRLISTAGKNYLYSPQPNPFSSQTTIDYEVAEDGYTEIFIYDALGTLVAELVKTDVQKGLHSVVFDGSSLQSGMYFIVMRKGDFVRTVRCTLAK